MHHGLPYTVQISHAPLLPFGHVTKKSFQSRDSHISSSYIETERNVLFHLFEIVLSMQYHEYPEDRVSNLIDYQMMMDGSPLIFGHYDVMERFPSFLVRFSQVPEKCSKNLLCLFICMNAFPFYIITDNSVIDSLNKQGQHFFYKARRNMKECKISDCTT